MEIIIGLICLIIGIITGWVFALYRIAKNTMIVELKKDEIIFKRPPETHVMICVTPDVARRLVVEKNYQNQEARSLILQNQNQASSH